MRTALECLAMAERCESMARSCSDEMDGQMLRETAQHWRALAKVAPGTPGETVPAAPTRGFGAGRDRAQSS